MTMRRALRAVVLLAGLPVASLADPVDRADLDLLITQTAAWASVSDGYQVTAKRLNSASSWFDGVAQSGTEWDEARMHARAIVRGAEPELDRLEREAAALTFTATDIPPIYGAVPRDRDLLLANIEVSRRHLDILQRSIAAAARRDAGALMRASYNIDQAWREVTPLYDSVVAEWLDKVPADHPDYLLALAMVELTGLWETPWPDEDADLEVWLTYYADGAALNDETGQRISAFGRAAAEALPAFEHSLAEVLSAAGVADAGRIAADASAAISMQSRATVRLGSLLRRNAVLLERTLAMDEDEDLADQFIEVEQELAAIYLELSHHFNRRFQILTEGVLQ